MATIHFDRVSKRFTGEGQWAVAECSFEVVEGSFVVFLGPSGCGKTTLLKMVNRLVEPTAGTIYLNDQDIRQLDVTTLRRQIGYVIQQIGLFPHLTVAQNIGVVPTLLKWSPEQIKKRVEQLLSLVELPPDDYANRYPAQMSGGQRQRVGVARALAGDPSLILMDEPFGALDAITRTSLQDELLHLQRRLKKTILFVTHDVEEALRLADKIVVMRAGKILQYAAPFTILRQPVNDFVHQLVGADDMVRQLGLVRVEAAMQPIPAHLPIATLPTIEWDSSLRQGLSALLRQKVPALVVQENQHPIGILTLEGIQQMNTLPTSTT